MWAIACEAWLAIAWGMWCAFMTMDQPAFIGMAMHRSRGITATNSQAIQAMNAFSDTR